MSVLYRPELSMCLHFVGVFYYKEMSGHFGVVTGLVGRFWVKIRALGYDHDEKSCSIWFKMFAAGSSVTSTTGVALTE